MAARRQSIFRGWAELLIREQKRSASYLTWHRVRGSTTSLARFHYCDGGNGFSAGEAFRCRQRPSREPHQFERSTGNGRRSRARLA